MKTRLGMATVALLLSFPGALVLRAQEELPEGEGKKVVERVCTECHGTDEITGIKRTPDQWRRIVKDMLDRRETKTSDEEAKQIIEYLIAHFSREPGIQRRDTREANRLSALGSRRALLNVPLGRVAPFTACDLSSVHLHDDFLSRSKAESHEPKACRLRYFSRLCEENTQ
jgi:hypothetical protein